MSCFPPTSALKPLEQVQWYPESSVCAHPSLDHWPSKCREIWITDKSVIQVKNFCLVCRSSAICTLCVILLLICTELWAGWYVRPKPDGRKNRRPQGQFFNPEAQYIIILISLSYIALLSSKVIKRWHIVRPSQHVSRLNQVDIEGVNNL